MVRIAPAPPVSTLLAKAAAPTAAGEKAEVEKRKSHYAERTFEARTRRLVHCWKVGLVLVCCMLLQCAGLGRLDVRMGIFLRVKSWRCVSLELI